MNETEKDALIKELVWTLEKSRDIIRSDLGELDVDFIDHTLKNAKKITGN